MNEDQHVFRVAHLTDIGGTTSPKYTSRATDETYRFYMRGDEFLIIAQQTSLTNAKLAADRKRKLIESTTLNVNDKNYKLTVSCGVT